MSVLKMLSGLNVAVWDGLYHLYWPYQRTTLCGESKVHRPTVWRLEAPVCPECAAELIELRLKAVRRNEAA